MEINEEYEKDPLVRGIREGTFYVIMCESLQDCLSNFTFCPNKDECDDVDYLGTDDMRDGYCSDCTEECWLVVGVSIEKNVLGSGCFVRDTYDPGFGKYMLNLVTELKKN